MKKSFEAKKSMTVEFLVDSGAVYSVVDAAFCAAWDARRTGTNGSFLPMAPRSSARSATPISSTAASADRRRSSSPRRAT